ncbi:MAG: uroporphyrinogen-III synthase [SAR324 cluster bacterium]|nr:uroporphyrinogen-III synthase [SAR324 cluster bacterium]
MAPNGSDSGDGPAPADEQAPLAGLTFLNTREASAAAELTQRLTRLGARVLEAPMLAFAPPPSWQPFDSRLAALESGDWVAFTSANAVRCSLERLRELGKPPSLLARGHIAAVGPGTAAALQERQLPVALLPHQFQGEGLLAALLERLEPAGRVWLPRAEQAREVLAEGLRQAGMKVAVTPVYRTVPPPGGLGETLDALTGGALDWIVFTSTSTVRNFFGQLPEQARAGLEGRWPRIACLGAVTAEAASGEGLQVAVTPQVQDLDGLVAAIVTYLQGSGEDRSG